MEKGKDGDMAGTSSTHNPSTLPLIQVKREGGKEGGLIVLCIGKRWREGMMVVL